MREIKFRAWDKKQQQMFSHKDLMDFTGGAVPFYRELYHAGIELPAILLPINQGHIVLMQYIGRRDSKGTEIYEGDIVRDNKGRALEVFQNELSLMWWFLEADGDGKSHVEHMYWENIEVIGNVFENPELMEVTE